MSFIRRLGTNSKIKLKSNLYLLIKVIICPIINKELLNLIFYSILNRIKKIIKSHYRYITV